MSGDAAKIRYEAHPSLIRMRPFATVLVLGLTVLGVLAALTGPTLVPDALAAWVVSIDPRFIQAGGALLFVLGLLQLLVWWVSTRTDRLKITDDEILWTHGLLSRNYTELSMGAVRSLQVSQSLFQRLVDAGDIRIFTTGDLPELVVRGLPAPNRIRELIRARGAGIPTQNGEARP